MPRQSGLSAGTRNKLVLDAGALYLNYGVANQQTKLGATRGGATFTVEQEVHDPEIDGAPGPVKGLRRIIRAQAMISATLLEFDTDQLVRYLVSSVKDTSSNTTHDIITRTTQQIADGAYYTNIAIVAELANKTNAGIFMVKNAIMTSPLALQMTDKDYATLPVEVVGHFDASAIGTEPWEIRWAKS